MPLTNDKRVPMMHRRRADGLDRIIALCMWDSALQGRQWALAVRIAPFLGVRHDQRGTCRAQPDAAELSDWLRSARRREEHAGLDRHARRRPVDGADLH